MIRISVNKKEYPDDFYVTKVRPWDDPIMMAAGFDSALRGQVGQFQVVTCYVTVQGGKWAGSWSAVSNNSKLNHSDMMKLANTQLLDFDYPFGMSDKDLIAVRNLPLRDGFTLQQKMGWLYQSDSDSRPSLEMWGSGEWYETTEARFGSMVNGGQMVKVSKTLYPFTVQMPNESSKRVVQMQELTTFRRADWGKSNKDFPYLLQKATTASYPGNVYGEHPRGFIYVPVALNPIDFPLSGSNIGDKYYLPAEWLV